MNKCLSRCIYGCILPLILLSSRGVLAAGKPLGTVFYSPAERAALVAARSAGEDERERAPEKVESSFYSISGIVIRGGGKSVAWLNGKPVVETPQDKSLPPISVTHDSVVIDGKPGKVGETLDVVSGGRVSPLPAGAVRVKP